MALTMTRTRNQTTLTRLAKLLANLNGELEFVALLAEESPGHRELLEARQETLLSDRDAVIVSLKQYDPTINIVDVGSLAEWMRPYGRPGRNTRTRYLARLTDQR